MGVGAPRLTVTHLAHSSLGVPHCRPVAWPEPSCMCRGAASVSSVCSLLMASSSFAKFCTWLPGTGQSGTSVKRSKTMSGTTPDGFSGGTLLRRGGQCCLARKCVMFPRNLHGVAGHQHQLVSERFPVLTRHCEEQERREADVEWIVFSRILRCASREWKVWTPIQASVWNDILFIWHRARAPSLATVAHAVSWR